MIQTEQPNEGGPVTLMGTAVKSSPRQLLSQGAQRQALSFSTLLGTMIVEFGFFLQAA